MTDRMWEWAILLFAIAWVAAGGWIISVLHWKSVAVLIMISIPLLYLCVLTAYLLVVGIPTAIAWVVRNAIKSIRT